LDYHLAAVQTALDLNRIAAPADFAAHLQKRLEAYALVRGKQAGRRQEVGRADTATIF
jgi:hypothetical protein